LKQRLTQGEWNAQIWLLNKPLHLETSSLTKPLAQHCSVPLCMRRQLVTILKCTSLCRVWAKMSSPPTGDDDDDDDHFCSYFLLVKPSLSTSSTELNIELENNRILIVRHLTKKSIEVIFQNHHHTLEKEFNIMKIIIIMLRILIVINFLMIVMILNIIFFSNWLNFGFINLQYWLHEKKL
jgi:hypothetical protein